jgi:DNA-directed RNA polymerase specialized sigma24 family protein
MERDRDAAPEPDWSMLMSRVRHITAELDPSDADDVLQETLVSYLEFITPHERHLGDDASLRILFAIARRRRVDSLRYLLRIPERLDDSSGSIPDESPDASEKHGWIEWVAANSESAGLSKRQAEYLRVCSEGARSFAEIGRETGQDVRDVRRLHATVCRRLRRVWEAS